jgi:hypothetical protein
VASVQFQFVPEMAMAVRPVGSVSTTVTVLPATTGPLPPLVTVMAYWAPVCPWVKLSECDVAMVRSGICVEVVTSLAASLVVLISPPPETVAVLVRLEGAEADTLTVSVMPG